MAEVRIIHYWAGDAGSTIFEVEIEASYPDAVDEARAVVMRMYRECVGITEPTGDDAPTT